MRPLKVNLHQHDHRIKPSLEKAWKSVSGDGCRVSGGQVFADYPAKAENRGSVQLLTSVPCPLPQFQPFSLFPYRHPLHISVSSA